MAMTDVTRVAVMGLLIAGSVAIGGCGDREAAKPSTSAVTPQTAAPEPATPAPPAPPAPASPEPAAYSPALDEGLSEWAFVGNKKLNKWAVATGPDGAVLATDALMGVNLYTKRKFGDCRVELEAKVPAGGNSGVFLMGEYELQLLDDPAVDPANPGDMDFGAIARSAKPAAWAFDGPGKWHKVAVDLTAPRFDAAGKKTANAKVTVWINGKLVHDGVELAEPTLGGLYGEERAEGPLMLQGNEGPAAFRAIRIVPRP